MYARATLLPPPWPTIIPRTRKHRVTRRIRLPHLQPRIATQLATIQAIHRALGQVVTRSILLRQARRLTRKEDHQPPRRYLESPLSSLLKLFNV